MNSPRVVRLWWRCRLCNRRFDTFGTDHEDPDDRRAAATEALAHFDAAHRRYLHDLNEAADLLVADRRTTRVVKHQLIAPFGNSASS